MYLRTISRWIVLTLVVVVGAVLVIHQQFAGKTSAAPAHTQLTAGTVLSGAPAPNFQLRDQSGATISLAGARGHPVVLTFIDATCTTQCPITAQYLDTTAKALGPQYKQVTWLAVSVNPANTPAQSQEFLAKNKVVVPLHVLLGSTAQLKPIWQEYHIAVLPPSTTGGDVQHTVVTYLIDGAGHERELLDQTFNAQQAGHDLSVLLGAR